MAAHCVFLDRNELLALSRGDWIAEGGNVIFAGPIGSGKTHLAIALGVEAARQRKRVAFQRAAELVCALIEARDQRELGRLQKPTRGVDLLILDEVGFVPFDRAGGDLLFNLLSDRHEQKRATVITTRGKSYRMRRRKAPAKAATTKPTPSTPAARARTAKTR